ncbi:hypothetical protein GCM10020331_055750 [Ectobacillus funiculus]
MAPPRIKKIKTMLTTLIRENQYSNSPNDLTEYTLVKVNKKVRTRLADQEGKEGNQYWIMFAPAIASTAMTITQKKTNIASRLCIQPTDLVLPEHTWQKEPLDGLIIDISPSMRMTKNHK